MQRLTQDGQNGPRLISGRTRRPRVIELSNGPDEAHIRVVAVPASLPVTVGHTWDYADPVAPVYTNGELVSPSSLNLDCPACESWLHIRPGPEFTFLVLEHRPGCTWLAHEFLASAQ